MAGTADNFDNTTVVIGPGKLYADLAVPGAGGRLILYSDGTPDATQNPDAKHIGYTREGTEFSIVPQVTNFFADESSFPIVSRVQQEVAQITGEALQVADFDLQEILNPTSTRTTIPGIDGVHFGGSNLLTYTCVAVVFPLEEDPTRYGVVQLYKAYNNAGLAARVTRTNLAGVPFAFQGIAIGTRPEGDQVGVFWKQNVVGS
jgi:hypothetical protein